MEIGKKLIGRLERILSWRTQCGGNREEIDMVSGARLVLENTMRQVATEIFMKQKGREAADKTEIN